MKLKTNFENVFKINLPVGHESSNAIINYDPYDNEKASLINDSTSLPKHQRTELVTIDQYVHDAKLNNVEFIKCDVEGYELQVLHGAIKTLKSFKSNISLEVTLEKNILKDALELLRSVDYKNFSKIEKGYLEFNFDTHNLSEEYFYLYATC